MKNTKIIFLVLFFSAFVAGIYFYKNTKINANLNVLMIGTSLDYPPYEFVDVSNGQPVGFDIDVLTKLAARMNKKLIIKNMPFTSLIFGLLAHDIDMIAAGMTPTERRARMVQFTDAYVQAKPLVIISKKSVFVPQSVADLDGKRVAVSTGYIADMKMSQHPEIKLVRLDSPAECFMALQVGSVDALVAAAINVDTFLQHQAHPEQYAIFEIAGTEEICAFAVNKDNQKLCDEINVALQMMQHDGTLKTIQQKWNL